jgi:hypothetical protein
LLTSLKFRSLGGQTEKNCFTSKVDTVMKSTFKTVKN